MEKIVLNDVDTITAKSFILSVLYWGDRYFTSSKKSSYHTASNEKLIVAKTMPKQEQAAALLYSEILNRDFTFIKDRLDDALTSLTNWRYSSNKLNNIRVCSQEELANYFAWFCQQNRIQWDDSTVSEEEFDDITKQTVLGRALYKAGRFISQVRAAYEDAMNNKNTEKDKEEQDTMNNTDPNVATQTQPNVAQNNNNNNVAPVTNTAPTSTSATTGKQPPKNSYKSTGGHIKDIPNAVTGQKEIFTDDLWVVIADKTTQSQPGAYITPLKTNNNGIAVVQQAEAEKIKFGAGHGYTDCALVFPNTNEADVVCKYCQDNFTGYQNIRIARIKPDKNGYFEVTTSALVHAYIPAVKLNESLEEDLSADDIQDEHINDSKLYREWLHRSIS